ncbi:MAG: PilZ domain-containing protein [Oligoflexia bacterium]|nr:PilZ domain-containing protein [Oligoflexia bacterium]
MNWWPFKKDQKPDENAQPSEAFLQSVREHAIDRRAAPRIRLSTSPHLGQGPKIEINGQVFLPNDVSVGGFRILDPRVNSIPIGSQLEVRWHSTALKEPFSFKATLLKKTEKGGYHFQFNSPSPHLRVHISSITEFGLRGAKTRIYKSHEIPADQGIVELWMSTAGDFLMKLQSGLIHMNLKNQRYSLNSQKVSVLSRGEGGTWSAVKDATQVDIENLLMFAINLHPQSPAVYQCISFLTSAIPTNSRVA